MAKTAPVPTGEGAQADLLDRMLTERAEPAAILVAFPGMMPAGPIPLSARPVLASHIPGVIAREDIVAGEASLAGGGFRLTHVYMAPSRADRLEAIGSKTIRANAACPADEAWFVDEKYGEFLRNAVVVLKT